MKYKKLHVIILISILFVLTVFSLLFSYLNVFEFLFSISIIFMLYKVFIFDDFGFHEVTILDNCFYFKDESKKIFFKDIEYLHLDIDGVRNNYSRKYTVSLLIKLKDKKLSICLNDTIHLDNFWLIIDGCRRYNSSLNLDLEPIRISSLIYDNESEFYKFISDCILGDKDVIKIIREHEINSYLEVNNMSREEYDKKLPFIIFIFCFGFFILLPVFLILINILFQIVSQI